MSDILTLLYLNIKNYSYSKSGEINHKDIMLLHQKRRQTIVVPSSIFLITFFFSRNRVFLWNRLKSSFLSNRNKFKIDEYNIKKKENSLNVSTNASSGRNNSANSSINYQEILGEKVTLNIHGSRQFKYKLNETQQINKVDLPRKEPTYSQEYLSFTKNFKFAPESFKKIKKITKNFKNYDEFANKSQNYLLNTKLIYIPFVFVLLTYLYDLGLTYLGLYFKYQPLINEYHNFKNSIKH